MADLFVPPLTEEEPPFSELEELADSIDPQASAEHWRNKFPADDSNDDFQNILDAEAIEDDG